MFGTYQMRWLVSRLVGGATVIMWKALKACALLALLASPATTQTYYQAPFTDQGAPWVIRNDLGKLPANNDDPALVPYKELINESDGKNDQKYFPLGQTANYVNDAYGAGSIIVSIILPFQRKASTNINLIFETPAPMFHCLNNGAPVWIGNPMFPYTVHPGFENYARAWNTDHLTRTNMSLALMLPWPNNFLSHVLPDR
jgi:hypothetical protein